MEAPVRLQFEERWKLLERVLKDPEAPDADVAWALGQMGRLFQAYRFVDQAMWCLESAHALDPENFDWAYILGQLHLSLGDGEAARKALEQAKSIRPEEPVVRVALGQIEKDAGRLDAAQAHYEAALRADPSSVVARYGMALVQLDQGLAADALETLRQLLEEQPNAYQLRYAMAQALRQLQRDDEAKSHLEAIDDSPINRVGLQGDDPWLRGINELTISSTAQERRGRQALVARQFQAAARYLELAREIAPDRREIRFNLAMAYSGQGRDDDALDLLDGVIEDFPDYSPSYRLRGRMLDRRGRRADARALLEKAVELDPASEANQRALGDFLLGLGEWKAAAACFEAALAVQNRSLQASLGLAQSHLVAGHWDAAAEVVRRGLLQRPGARPLVWLGLRLQAAGVASPPLPEALSPPHGPNTVFELESAAMAWAWRGSLKEAVEHQERALEVASRLDLMPHRPEMKRRLQRYQDARSGVEIELGPPWVDGERLQGPGGRRALGS